MVRFSTGSTATVPSVRQVAAPSQHPPFAGLIGGQHQRPPAATPSRGNARCGSLCRCPAHQPELDRIRAAQAQRGVRRDRARLPAARASSARISRRRRARTPRRRPSRSGWRNASSGGGAVVSDRSETIASSAHSSADSRSRLDARQVQHQRGLQRGADHALGPRAFEAGRDDAADVADLRPPPRQRLVPPARRQCPGNPADARRRPRRSAPSTPPRR